MKAPQSYYLFKAGRLVGPVSAQKIESLRQSKEILQYSWMMDEERQTWTTIEAMPNQNPFESTQKSLKERHLSAAFIHRNQVVEGSITGIHAYGIEMTIPKSEKGWNGLKPESALTLNLVDETGLKNSNSMVIFQGNESHENEMILRFQWKDEPSPL